VQHPTGGADAAPVILAQGDPAGPVFWLTAGIHGNEHAGIQVIHQLLTEDLVRQLRGTIVAIPALSPAGLRTVERQPYYHKGDPNRLFPELKPRKDDPDDDPPSALENAYTRLFAALRKTRPIAWIDLHNAWTNSISFVFRDRVYYRGDGSPTEVAERRSQAETIDRALVEMCAAYGHTVVHEYPPDKFLGEKLHRSTTAAAVNVAGIPALTLELGTGHMPDQSIVQACVCGLRNLLRWAGMLRGEREPIRGIRVADPGFPCRHRGAPRVPVAAIVRHLLDPGDRVTPGQAVAELRDIWGRPLDPPVLHSEYEGFIVGRTHGIAHYPGKDLYCMAIRDDLPTVLPWPEKYVKEWKS
jgi:predicted deacylase